MGVREKKAPEQLRREDKQLERSELFDLYKLLNGRIEVHYELRNKHLNSMLAFQAALLTILSLVVKDVPSEFRQALTVVIAAMGFLLSIFWSALSNNDKDIQFILNDVLSETESKLGLPTKLSLYTTFRQSYEDKRLPFDAVNVLRALPLIAIVIWFTVGIASLFLWPRS